MGDAQIVLRQWTTFYAIVGSSAGALTGLQFVVIALIMEAQGTRSMMEIRAFGTPTVVHFCGALLISALTCAPWHKLSSLAICLGVTGAGGVLYLIRVVRHAKRQTGYRPDLADWAWYAYMPLAAHLILLTSAIALARRPGALFVAAAAALMLLFIGIHNAWDTVTYIAIERGQHERPEQSG